ncbi:MAG: nucleotidyltransferase [Deltaproteobacteria bacterium]|nr:MAG: nucleotidyltransferase [Deltaproteobacteria bacterium]
MAADPAIALRNTEAALGRLELFLAVPVRDERERAGVIQAFEVTFEACWKLLQKVAQLQGLQAASPKAAMVAGFQLGLCEPEAVWLQMLVDRNLTVHTCRADLADVIFQRIVKSHAAALRSAVEASRALLQLP